MKKRSIRATVLGLAAAGTLAVTLAAASPAQANEWDGGNVKSNHHSKHCDHHWWNDSSGIDLGLDLDLNLFDNHDNNWDNDGLLGGLL